MSKAVEEKKEKRIQVPLADGLTRISAIVPTELGEKIKQYAEREERTLVWVVAKWLQRSADAVDSPEPVKEVVADKEVAAVKEVATKEVAVAKDIPAPKGFVSVTTFLPKEINDEIIALVASDGKTYSEIVTHLVTAAIKERIRGRVKMATKRAKLKEKKDAQKV